MKWIVLGCVCLALGPGAANAAAAGWLPPEEIAGVSEAITAAPQIALDATGDAVAVGLRQEGLNDVLVEAVERPAGGEWSDSDLLSDPDFEQPGGLQLGVDAAGNAVAVWGAFYEGEGEVIRTASRTPGGEWSEPEFLSTDAMPGFWSRPRLAVNANGDAVAVWVDFDSGDQVVVGAVRPAGDEWSEPTQISDDGEDTQFPEVGIDAAGNTIAVWLVNTSGVTGVVQAAALPAGEGEWSEPDDLSAMGDPAKEPRIAVSAAGDAVAVWTVDIGDSSLHAKTRPPGGDWSEQEDVSGAGEDVLEPEVAIDSNGAVATWLAEVGGDEQIVRGAALPNGEDEWSEPEDLSFPADEYRSSAVEKNSAAGAIAIWTRFDGSTNWVQAAVRPPGGDWSEPEDLSEVGEEAGLASLAFDPAGNAIGIWGREIDVGFIAETTGYDFVPPRLDDLRVPATGTAGEPVAFAVTPFDVFPLGATTWAFGDGGSGGGNAVSHVYSAAGTYPVTVTALDGGGNASSQTRTIAIAPRPPEPRRQITLSLQIARESLPSLLRSGTLSVTAAVNDPASVVLSGRARLKVGKGKARKLVTIFQPKVAQFAAAGERRLQLTLTDRGRNRLKSLSQVKIVIAGEASAGAGNAASVTVAQNLRDKPRR